MIQTLKNVKRPSTSEKFGQAFANAGQSLGESYSDYRQTQEDKSNREKSDRAIKERFGIDLSDIDPEQRKLILSQKLIGQNQQELQKNKPPSASDLKSQKENEESEKVRETAQKSFNGIAGLLKKNNVGRGSGVIGSLFGGETAKDTGEFNSLSGGLEAMLVDMVSRGTLSNSRFRYITETLLPKPTDRQKEIEGKLKGLAEILGLDASELVVNEKSGDKSNGKMSLEEIFQ